MRILIADDAAFMRAMLRDTLVKAGYEIVGEAVDGEDAVSKYAALKPDLVTMDLTMPKLDGEGALVRIRQADPMARIIVCSAVGQEAMIKKLLLAGARDYLIKPFESAQVLSTVKRALLEKADKPNSSLEELVAWYELGELVLRHGMVSPAQMQAVRADVEKGVFPSVYKGLVDQGLVAVEDLEELLAEGHRDVSLAYFLMRAKAIGIEQLRCALVLMRKSGRLLGFTLVEHGFCAQQQIADIVKKIPPYKSSATVRI